jgi:putative transposase
MLAPQSTAPKRVRCMLVDPKVLLYITSLREDHPRLGKTKIKPLLDLYCQKEILPTYSIAKIGRIIHHYKLFYQKQGRIYHHPKAKGYAMKVKRNRVRHAPRSTNFGYLQMDTITKVTDGVKWYLYCAVDVGGRFALSLPYKTLTSRNTVDFMTKLISVCPFPVTQVQTDNGHEFLGEFEGYLSKLSVGHLFTYPRCPKINGVVERFNRTIQEEFIDSNLFLLHNEPEVFSQKLADYLIFYNCQRVHQALNYRTPMDYLLQKGGMSKKYWTRTTA